MRYRAGTLFLAIGLAASAAAAQSQGSDRDLIAPDQAEEVEDAAWVDPRIAQRDRCFDRPGRPQWVVDQPRWRREIAETYVALQSRRRVVETGDCSCENVYLDYEDYRNELVELLAQFPATASRFQEGDADRVVAMQSEITKRRGELAADYRRTCRGI